jgi:quercetin dioxygenase-like cupin family protein
MHTHRPRATFRMALPIIVGLVAPLPGTILEVGLASAQQAGNHGVKATPVFRQKMPNVPGKTMTVVSVEYEPGGGSAAHRHPASGMVFAYVLEGSIRSQLEGEPTKVYRAGEHWSEPPNAHHIVSENASNTEPARLLAIIVADDDAMPTVFDK